MGRSSLERQRHSLFFPPPMMRGAAANSEPVVASPHSLLFLASIRPLLLEVQSCDGAESPGSVTCIKVRITVVQSRTAFRCQAPLSSFSLCLSLARPLFSPLRFLFKKSKANTNALARRRYPLPLDKFFIIFCCRCWRGRWSSSSSSGSSRSSSSNRGPDRSGSNSSSSSRGFLFFLSFCALPPPPGRLRARRRRGLPPRLHRAQLELPDLFAVVGGDPHGGGGRASGAAPPVRGAGALGGGLWAPDAEGPGGGAAAAAGKGGGGGGGGREARQRSSSNDS